MTSSDILKSKTKEPLKVLSSSGIRGTKFIPVYNFPARYHPSFGNQHILNFEVMAVRDITERSHLSKKRLCTRKSAFVNISWFGLDNKSTR